MSNSPLAHRQFRSSTTMPAPVNANAATRSPYAPMESVVRVMPPQ